MGASVLEEVLNHPRPAFGGDVEPAGDGGVFPAGHVVVVAVRRPDPWTLVEHRLKAVRGGDLGGPAPAGTLVLRHLAAAPEGAVRRARLGVALGLLVGARL